MSEKIAISRIQLSGPMQGIQSTGRPDRTTGPRLCHLLGSKGINIAFAAMGVTCDGFSSLCCIADQDMPRARALIDQDNGLQPDLSFLPAVGLVDLFPHRHRFPVFALALKALVEERIRIHSLASSISALSFVIDFHRMPDARSAL